MPCLLISTILINFPFEKIFLNESRINVEYVNMQLHSLERKITIQIPLNKIILIVF